MLPTDLLDIHAVEESLRGVELGALDEPLLVQRPHPSGGQPAVGRGQHGLREVRQRRDPVAPAGMRAADVQRPCGHATQRGGAARRS
jgi:hypothetical protein